MSEDNINHAVAAVRGTDIVGTNVALTFQQIGTGRKFDVSLVRGAWGAVERKEKLFILFEVRVSVVSSLPPGPAPAHSPLVPRHSPITPPSLSCSCSMWPADLAIFSHTQFRICDWQEVIKLVKRESPAEDVLKVMHHVVEQAKDNEKARSLQEMKIQNHLRALQSEMHRLLKAAKERCEVRTHVAWCNPDRDSRSVSYTCTHDPLTSAGFFGRLCSSRTPVP